MIQHDKPLFTLEIEAGQGTGFVVIDSVVNNTSSGGVRIAEDLSRGEVRTLAREMTLKFSFMGLPRGGGKSGVQIPAGVAKEERLEILREYGKGLAPIIHAGIYYPGMDMNCGPEELRAIYAGAGITVGEVTDTSFFTAISAANSILACAEAFPQNKPLTIAIEGFGSVGAYLAARLPQDRFRIVAISTIKGAVVNPAGFLSAELVDLRRQFGDDLVTKVPDGRAVSMNEVLAAQVDILVPSARILSLNEQTAELAQARYIVPVANAPYTDQAVTSLFAKGIACLPGFVVNAGGVYASSLHDSGLSVAAIEQISGTLFRKVVATLVTRSRELKLPPVRLAEMVALRRLAAGERMVLPSKIKKKAFQMGILPSSIYGKMFSGAFCDNLRTLERQIAGFEC